MTAFSLYHFAFRKDFNYDLLRALGGDNPYSRQRTMIIHSDLEIKIISLLFVECTFCGNSDTVLLKIILP